MASFIAVYPYGKTTVGVKGLKMSLMMIGQVHVGVGPYFTKT